MWKKDAKIEEKDAKIAEKDAKIEENYAKIEEKEGKIVAKYTKMEELQKNFKFRTCTPPHQGSKVDITMSHVNHTTHLRLCILLCAISLFFI